MTTARGCREPVKNFSSSSMVISFSWERHPPKRSQGAGVMIEKQLISLALSCQDPHAWQTGCSSSESNPVGGNQFLLPYAVTRICSWNFFTGSMGRTEQSVSWLDYDFTLAPTLSFELTRGPTPALSPQLLECLQSIRKTLLVHLTPNLVRCQLEWCSLPNSHRRNSSGSVNESFWLVVVCGCRKPEEKRGNPYLISVWSELFTYHSGENI